MFILHKRSITYTHAETYSPLSKAIEIVQRQVESNYEIIKTLHTAGADRGFQKIITKRSPGFLPQFCISIKYEPLIQEIRKQKSHLEKYSWPPFQAFIKEKIEYLNQILTILEDKAESLSQKVKQ